MKTMTCKKIFISRQLEPNSPWFQLRDYGFAIYAESLISIEYLKFDLPPEIRHIFFYSANGVRAFFDQHTHHELIQYAAMGPGTAQAFRVLTQANPDLIGDGTSEHMSRILQQHWSNEKILFIKATHSKSSVEALLNSKNTISCPAYVNKIRQDFELPMMDIVVFTSPLNVQAYFEKYQADLNSNTVFYSIGKTTADFLRCNYNVKSKFCEKPSMKALYELVYRDWRNANPGQL